MFAGSWVYPCYFSFTRCLSLFWVVLNVLLIFIAFSFFSFFLCHVLVTSFKHEKDDIDVLFKLKREILDAIETIIPDRQKEFKQEGY